MTTAVTVETFEHEVDVHRLNPKTGESLVGVERMPKREKRIFYVHSTQGLAIKEVEE